MLFVLKLIVLQKFRRAKIFLQGRPRHLEHSPVKRTCIYTWTHKQRQSTLELALMRVYPQYESYKNVTGHK